MRDPKPLDTCPIARSVFLALVVLFLAGFLAPGLGRPLVYLAIKYVGVGRAVPLMTVTPKILRILAGAFPQTLPAAMPKLVRQSVQETNPAAIRPMLVKLVPMTLPMMIPAAIRPATAKLVPMTLPMMIPAVIRPATAKRVPRTLPMMIPRMLILRVKMPRTAKKKKKMPKA